MELFKAANSRLRREKMLRLMQKRINKCPVRVDRNFDVLLPVEKEIGPIIRVAHAFYAYKWSMPFQILAFTLKNKLVYLKSKLPKAISLI